MSFVIPKSDHINKSSTQTTLIHFCFILHSLLECGYQCLGLCAYVYSRIIIILFCVEKMKNCVGTDTQNYYEIYIYIFSHKKT